MANINEILARAESLRKETALNSIDPERAGGIMYDTLLALNELWLQQGAALVISKIYASVAAMEADTEPVSDLTGKPLRPGQIVVIASSDSDNGSVYRYNGTDSPSWSLVGNIGNLEPVDNLESDSATLPLAAHQGKVLDGKISQLGQKGKKEINSLLFGGDIYEYLYSISSPGYIANSASSGTLPAPTPSDTVRYILFPVYAGDIFNTSLYSGNSARAWTIVDKSMSIIQTARGGGSYITKKIAILNDGYILFNLFNNVTGLKIEYNGLGTLRRNVFNAIDYPIENLTQTRVENKLYYLDGSEYPSESFTTTFFSVTPGDSILVKFLAFPSENFSNVSAWNNGVFVSPIVPTPQGTGEFHFIVPENCTEIGVSRAISAERMIYVNEAISLLNKKRIRCLFIGNSVSQDHVSYLPWLLKNTYPDLYFEIYQAYCGGKTIKEYVTDIIPNDRTLDIFSEAKNVANWTNRTNVTFDDMFDFATFDLICFEGYFHNTDHGSSDEDTAYFEQLINHIRSLQNSPFKIAYLIHQQYDDDIYPNVNVLQTLINAARFTIANNEVTMIFPCGLVTELVKSSFGTSFLTPDNIHNNQGLPCIMGAYTLLGNIAKYLGLKDAIINNQNRITSEIEQTLNIPGPNGSLKVGTEQQYKEAQTAAVMAIKYSDYLTIDAASSIIQINP